MNGSHEFWTDKLSDWLDGDLPEREAEAVGEHLAACNACRKVESELAEVRRQARALSHSGPGRDLWPAIKADLGRDPLADDVIDLTRHLDAEAPAVQSAAAPREGIFLGFPQLVAAALVLVFGGWAMGAITADSTSGRATAASVVAESPLFLASQALGAPEISTRLGLLEGQVRGRRDEIPANVLEVLDRNLALIDRAIAESLAALQQQPDAPYLRGQLEAALQRRESALTSTVRILDRGE